MRKSNSGFKKYIFIIFISSIFFGCNEIQKQNIDLPPAKGVFEPIKKSSLEGVWVREGYIASLKKSFSPAEAFNYAEGLSSILIKIKNQRKDSIEVGLSYNNHEGSSTFLVVDEYRYFLELHEQNKSANIELFFKNDTLSFDYMGQKHNFLKVLDTFPYGSDGGIGVQYVTNKILFGNRKFREQNTGEIVDFKENGIVENLGLYNKYRIKTDFVESNNLIDYMYLTRLNQQKSFRFKFEGEFLRLYEPIDSNEIVSPSYEFVVLKER